MDISGPLSSFHLLVPPRYRVLNLVTEDLPFPVGHVRGLVTISRVFMPLNLMLLY